MKARVYRLIPLLLTLMLLQSSGFGRSTLPAEAAQTITPDALLRKALNARQLGRYDQAAAGFQEVLQSFPQAPEAELARYSLGESAFLRQDWPAAISLLEDFLAHGQDQTLHDRALILLARSYESIGQHELAVAAYARYEARGGLLSGYAAIRRAAQLEALGRREEAAAAYELGGSAPIAPEQRAQAYEAAIRLRRDLDQREQVLANIEQVLGFARVRSYRNQLLTSGAELAVTLGRLDQAAGFLREIVERSPESAEALAALATLQSLGQGVDPLAAGRVLFSHERYAEAIAQFDAAIAGQLSNEDRLSARRLRALAIRATGDYVTAEAELRALADTSIGREALLDAIQTRGWSGDIAGAMAGYRAFADQFPDDPLAPEALRRVVELTARYGDQQAVAEAQLELGRRYPASRQGRQALISLGISAFQQGHYQQSLAAWKILADGNTGEIRSQGLYWSGRLTNDLGDPGAAAELLRGAYQTAPDSYYGVRAAELLGIVETAGLEIGARLPAVEQQIGMLWIVSWFDSPAANQAATAPEALRARELEAVYLLPEAAREWIAAKERLKENPVALYQIALEAHQAGHDRVALEFAEAIVRLVPDTAPPLPVALRRLLYPTPWSEIVQAESATYGVDPLLVYAIMRQESRFNPQATSWVGARGLMQVMPATGEGIAANLQVSPFSVDDLYDPATSIRFGAYYIGAQVQAMGGSIHGGMAAYNGGFGNARRWAGGEQVFDPDVYLLTIDFRETRHYVEVCYANYGAYKRLYRR
ncbi:MAG: lytic transglycosylase [Herpetosiphonaceae bacterium]|nr:MAG: lytic transglycosylase [Herpetosiphonaceae bacterium]